jgi:hypothetical protein
MARVSEADVAKAVVRYLEERLENSATNYQIKKALPGYLNLSDADRVQSDTRPREELWEQQVRNIVSHRTIPGNFIHEGRLQYTPRRLTLTAAGVVYAKTL